MIEKHDYELSRNTTFKIGGKTETAYFPENEEEFFELLKKLKDYIVIGGGSDLIISSKGIKEPVIITTEMKNYSVENNLIKAEAGVKAPFLSKIAGENGLSGFEFMLGIPGTMGGLTYMNASAHNQAIENSFVSCRVFDKQTKEIFTITKEEMNFSYRHSILADKNYVIGSCVFELEKGNKEEIEGLMERNLEFRRQRQPSLALPNAGSIFKNPENDSAGRLLDKAGVKSLYKGGAKVWENHANFIVNIGYATSNDILMLMKEMQDTVLEKYTIKLKPEVKFIGIFDEQEKTIIENLYK